MSTYTGSCHCGQTEWQVKLDGDAHILCHCDACKVMSGGEFTMNQTANKDDFKLTKGKLGTYTYAGDSGKPVHCYYCPNCTSNPYHHQTVAGDKIVIRTSLLHNTKSLPVAAEIYGKDKLHWQPKVGETVFSAGPE